MKRVLLKDNIVVAAWDTANDEDYIGAVFDHDTEIEVPSEVTIFAGMELQEDGSFKDKQREKSAIQNRLINIDNETRSTILSKYDEIEQANIMRLAMVEMYKAMQGMPTDNTIVAQALEANAFIEATREAGRQKKADIENGII